MYCSLIEKLAVSNVPDCIVNGQVAVKFVSEFSITGQVVVK